MRNLLSRLKSEILVFDGAMGTMLMRRGLPAGACPEAWNLSHPRVIVSIHRAYADAGADIITTNTLGGNRIALKDSDLADHVEEVNSSAVRLAREAAGDRRYVAGSVGPTGRFIEPFGPLTFEEAYEAFKEQTHALVRAGVDCLILETMVDLQEARACLLAVREVAPYRSSPRWPSPPKDERSPEPTRSLHSRCSRVWVRTSSARTARPAQQRCCRSSKR